jgi:hypothetical protein
VFLAGLASAPQRGQIVTVNELMIAPGQLIAYSSNALLGSISDSGHVWQWMLGARPSSSTALAVRALRPGIRPVARQQGAHRRNSQVNESRVAV